MPKRKSEPITIYIPSEALAKIEAQTNGKSTPAYLREVLERALNIEMTPPIGRPHKSQKRNKAAS